MGGKGTFAVGNNVGYTYKTVGKIDGIKVLKGLVGKHGYRKKHILVLLTLVYIMTEV